MVAVRAGAETSAAGAAATGAATVAGLRGAVGMCTAGLGADSGAGFSAGGSGVMDRAGGGGTNGGCSAFTSGFSSPFSSSVVAASSPASSSSSAPPFLFVTQAGIIANAASSNNAFVNLMEHSFTAIALNIYLLIINKLSARAQAMTQFAFKKR